MVPTPDDATPNARPCLSEHHYLAPSHCLPKIIRVEEPREFRIDIHDMDITFLVVPDHGSVVVTCAVRIDVDTERAVDLKLESNGWISSPLKLDSIQLEMLTL